MQSKNDAKAVLRHLHEALRAAKTANLTNRQRADLDMTARASWEARLAGRPTETEQRLAPVLDGAHMRNSRSRGTKLLNRFKQWLW